MAKILVTGGTGFIGKVLVARLARDGRSTISLGSGQGEIDNAQTWHGEELAGVEWVFHLAGKTFVPHSWEDPVGFVRTNVLGTTNALEFCRERQIPLTYVSGYLYGQPDSLPITEDAPLRPNNPYAMSKWMSEKLCEFYAGAHGLSVTVIRPFNVQGVGQDARFLIPTIVRQALFEDVIAVKDLSPKRDYVYVDDLVDALVLTTMANAGGYSVYNIGSGMSFSVQQIIDLVQLKAGTRKKIVCALTRRPNEIDDVVADVSRARDRLGWRPKHSLEDGIGKIVRAALGSQV